MANKNIKGITIDIGGNTTKLQDALKDVDKQVYSLNSDLKSLNQALKLDPKNTELLSQKQEVLARNISATKEKLQTLKEAQKQMGDYNHLTDEQKSSYNQLSLEIAKSEKALKDMNKELKTTSGIDTEKLEKGLKKVGEVALDVSKKLLQVTTAISGALTGIVSLGVKSYADFEQNVGGIQKLFGESADDLIEKSKMAYKTAGISANEYMETATSFSASLLKSVGGDTEKAVALTDRAIQDMSDNANTFGTSMDEVMNVYKALSKEQFSTLDNLKLGYAGTKEGMKQLIKDASQYKDIQAELGITIDESSMSYDNMINAISVMQRQMNIAGTTTKEAEGTITGSINMVKASFDNFINGSGSPEDLADAMTSMLKNIAKAVGKLAPQILKGIVSLFSSIAPQVVTLVKDLLPQLITAVQELINSLLQMLLTNTAQIQMGVTQLLNMIIQFLTANLPLILQAGITIVVTLVQGIIGAIPTLAEALPQLVTTILNVLIENIPLVLETAIQLLTAIVEAIPVIIEALIDNLPNIIDTIVTTLIDNFPLLLEASIKLLMALIEAIPKIIVELVKAIPTIITSIVTTLWNNRSKILEAGKQILLQIRNGITNNINKLYETIKEMPKKIKDWFVSGLTTIKEIGTEIVHGIWEGISDGYEWIKGKLKEWTGNVLNYLKKLFGIKSPSKVMRDQVGVFLAQGIGVGFEEEMKDVEKEMGDAIPIDSLVNQVDSAMRGLNYGINSSVNPQINPNITFDQNYQLMANAMKDALSDMEVALDDREVGKFVTKTITEEIYGG